MSETQIASFEQADFNECASEAVDALAVDGVVCIRNATNGHWLSQLESGIAAALAGASTDVDIVRRDGDTGSFSFSSGAWQAVDEFRRFIFDSPLADTVWPLLDSDQLVLFYDFLLIKEARSARAATPWHQDHSYYPIDGRKVVNSWTALDPIPLETALRFIRGSHQPGILYRAVDFDDPAAQYRHARNELALPETGVGNGEIVATALNPGDMLVWSSYTLHTAPGNALDTRRAAFSVNWVGDDVTFNGHDALDTYLDATLEVGEPIICDKFPLVRS